MRRALSLSLLPALLGLLALPLAASGRPTAVSPHALVKVAYNKTLKAKILVDAHGFTLYVFTQDTRNYPTCYDDQVYHCSRAWVPLRTTDAPRAGAGVKASLLGTAKRTDGARQVTYRGQPLYTDAGSRPSYPYILKADKRPGDVNGQNFIDSWFAVSPSGALVKR